jgi:hypothetical protein
MDLRDGRRAGVRAGRQAVKLICVPPWQAHEFLQLAYRHIEAAIERVGLSDLHVTVSDVLSGRSLLWLAVEDHGLVLGAGVTAIEQAPNGKVCVIVAWGSDEQSRCDPLLSTIEQFARDEGCVAVRLYGRTGWQRRLADYRVKAVIMERSL